MLTAVTICDTSPSTLLSLSLVNKTFNRSARSFKNRSQTFTYRSKYNGMDKAAETQVFIRTLLTNPSKRGAINDIRHITVDSLIEWYTNTFNMRRFSQRLDGDDGFDFEWLETPETVRQRWEPLAKLISQIPCLRSFTFGGGDQMPLVLIQALEKYQPRAHLHIRDWARVKDDEE